MAKLVYLDSNDFSDLSVPSGMLSPENKSILHTLRAHKADGSARFFISAIHISEAVHAAATHKEAAVRRADLMRELCGNNVLLHPQELCEREVSKRVVGESNGTLTHEELLSKDDEWFGVKHDYSCIKVENDNARQELAIALRKIPRAERRRRHLSLDFTNEKTRQAIRALIHDGSPVPRPPFPFSLIDQNLIIDCFLGQKTEQEFSRALISCLRDPYVLFQHVVDRTGHREALYNITRDQGEHWKRALEKVVADFVPLFDMAIEFKHDLQLRERVYKLFADINFDKKMIANFTERDGGCIDDASVVAILDSCPSMAAYCEVMKGYLFSILDANYSSIKAGKSQIRSGNISDFGDFMHSVYAPYFDVFRCDSKFGGILKSINGLRPRIADKRIHLIKMLEAS
jgi:hypothetical protein